MDDIATPTEALALLERRSHRVRIFVYVALLGVVVGVAILIFVAFSTLEHVREISHSDHVLLEQQETQLTDLQRLANQQAEHLQAADRNRDILQARVIQLQEALGAKGVEVPPPTDEQIAAQVAAYCASGACTGPPGPPGEPGKSVCVRPNGRPC